MTFKELIKTLDPNTRIRVYLEVGDDDVIPLGESDMAEKLQGPAVNLIYGDYEVSFMSIMMAQEGVCLNIAIK